MFIVSFIASFIAVVIAPLDSISPGVSATAQLVSVIRVCRHKRVRLVGDVGVSR